MKIIFSSLTLDMRRSCLFGPAGQIRLRPKSFEVLRYLAERAGQTVTKDELIAAIWPNVTVSEDSLTRCISDIRLAIGDPAQEIIKTLPKRGYLLEGPVSREDDQSDPSGGNVALADKPSIAVMPFVNLSTDPEQDFFADGMVDDIITALSHFKALLVIARTSGFTYKGRAADVKHIGRELGVRYVLEGSVRKAADRVRITGQLIDTASGAHLWANRIDGSLGDIFDLQDQVAESVVSAIVSVVEKVEIERARRQPKPNLDAHVLYLRGMAKMYQFASQRANEEALRLFYRAIELDPYFAPAYGRAASCYARFKADSWVVITPDEIAEVKRLARKAIELGRDDAIALSGSGWALAFVVRDLGAAADLMDRALVLNSNLAEAWRFSGWVKSWLGEPEAAIERFARAMRLDPLDPRMGGMRSGVAHAHFFARHYDEAAGWAAMALQDSPDFQPALRIAAASDAMAGRLEAARRSVARLRELNPTLLVSNLKEALGPYQKADDVSRYEEGLRQAGLPE
ncbi:winged helix-turn-helix domain-containing protein [Bradyrhizobium sp. WYCCWR 12699]|uniref:winged helix-turn-helix domain-containing tetratricopeptide repeat protein n=1 Tax=Bradyrhizobium sp. WYCCWR 12699 TaxID=3064203 RepID=UPI0028A456E0|nr:winged helix-turn-helix domain-containing protein [Bradyrhizobium sp. WYCCWR 12699]MDT4741848.1 winged helix-turn-helix domain-containing protein [Bradyrhizobium sp. WYCCWR 12699]